MQVLARTPGVETRPIKLPELRASGFYWRADDPLAATEFTYSRFPTPTHRITI
jgi:hypothetical protein